MSVAPRSISPRQAVTALALTAALAAGAGAVAPSPAAAASSITACFSYGSTPIRNLSTNVDYLTRGGRWAWLGAPARTDARGCIRYRMTGAHRRYTLRVRASGVMPQWRGMLDGVSPWAGHGGNHAAYLGRRGLRFSPLPAAAPPAPRFGGVDTGAWLDGMSSGSAGSGCSSSTGMMVACYMDQHGLHGNVIFFDYDGDGVQDAYDSYPRDGRYS